GWRWAFFIMVPAGALSALGSWAFVPETPRRPERRLDWLGFTMLILALGAFQLLLNRGQRLDWFGSTEIVIAATVAALAFYLFVVQSLTSAHPFLEPRIFKDRNVATGMAVGLVWGLLLNGIVVLFSLLMQNLRGYPVVTMGLLLVPRGLGMMLALIVVQRLMGLIDERHLIACGMLSMAATGWLASGWDTNVGTWEVATAGALQGFSTGFSWVPLVTKAFSTVARRLRTEGLVVFHLLIQIGQGAGVAIAINILSRTSNVSHASLTEHVTPYNEVLRGPDIPELWDPGSMSGLAAIEREISRQAEMIGYLNNFHYLMVLSLVAIPLVYLFRRRAFGGPTPPDD
ncbi:MAG: EmrB/QacA family drug resistance transporter, partial [Alphaproteobacteria bacterium]